MSTLRQIAGLLCAGALLVACGEVRTPLETSAGPVTLDIVSGDAQIGVAGAELPAALKVRAVVGAKKLPGLLVNFRITAGSGRMYAGSSITDRDGLAQDYWTLGSEIGTVQRVEVVAVDPTTGVKQNFGAFTARGAASALPKLDAMPATVDFGATNLGTPTPSTTVTVTNLGAASATGIAVAVTGSASSFEITGNTCAGATLSFAQACTVAVRLNPSTEGTLTGSLGVTPGSGAAASIALQGLGVGTPALGIAPAAIDFGAVALGASSATQTFVVSNAGNGSSGTMAVQLTGTSASQFQLVTNQCVGVALAPAATCAVSVRFQPTASGTKSAQLTVSGTPGGTVSAALSGTGASALLQLSPGVQDFGFVSPMSLGSFRTLTVTNVGTLGSGTIAFSLSNPQDYFIDSTTCTTLAPSASCQAIVKFLPRGTGSVSGAIAANAAPGGTTTSTFTGIGTNPVLVTTPTSLNFGSVHVGSASTYQLLSVYNTGSVSIATGALTTALAGANAAEFSIGQNNCNGLSLNPGASCTIAVRFQPTVNGSRTAQLQLFGANGPSIGVPLAGNGVLSAALSLTPTSHDFGSVAVGSSSTPQQFTVTNTGNATSGAITSAITGSGAAAFVSGSDSCVGQTLAPGATCQVSVTYEPTTSGASSATLQLSANTGGTVSALLSGTTASGTPVIVLTPTTATFVTTVGSSSGASFTVANTGTAPTVVSVSLTGSDVSLFRIASSTCSGPLNPGGGCTVTVVFQPAVPGNFSAQLEVTSGAPTVTALLSAQGR